MQLGLNQAITAICTCNWSKKSTPLASRVVDPLLSWSTARGSSGLEPAVSAHTQCYWVVDLTSPTTCLNLRHPFT